MYKYEVELILEGIKDINELRDSLKEISENIRVNFLEEKIKLCLVSPFPTQVFDTCAQFGRLKSVRVEEV